LSGITANDESIVLSASDAELRAALAEANIPTLLLVVAHLTGDPKWLAEPYLPTRTIGINDNDAGGLPVGRQQEIRAAAFVVLSAWRDGRFELPAPPDDEQITGLLALSLGEPLPGEYATSMAEEAGFRPRAGVDWTNGRPAAADEMHVVVIGAGIAGVGAAVTLKRLGIRYTVIERNPAIGGVWLTNAYPGAGVDTPTSLYSYSFTRPRAWQRYYAKQAEILGYVQETARDFGVEDNIVLRTEVTGAQWDDDAKIWRVHTRADTGVEATLEATAIVSCVGVFSRPVVPDVPGLDRFIGPVFHSSQWDHSIDIAGKTVAVIGTGATSVQIIPEIADTAAKVIVVQRSPQWVIPNPNYLRTMSDGVKLLMEQVPYYASFYRLRLVWMFQDKLLPTLRRDPDWPHPERSVNAVNDRHRVFLTKYIDEQLGERTDLREKVLPTYPPYGKRIIVDNNWFKTLKRDDVELVAAGVAGLDEHHVITTDGQSHQADVVVFATGFDVSHMLAPMNIRGRSGATLAQTWKDGNPWAYLGITVPDFPNFFMMAGPNSGLGHGGSAIYVFECALAYTTRLLIRLAEDNIGAIEVRRDIALDYTRRVDEEHQKLVWTHPGMTTWFRNASGRIVIVQPWRGVDYWKMTTNPQPDDFITRPQLAPNVNLHHHTAHGDASSHSGPDVGGRSISAAQILTDTP
jgi:4-hydroxyacetophenone monooxygenase